MGDGRPHLWSRPSARWRLEVGGIADQLGLQRSETEARKRALLAQPSRCCWAAAPSQEAELTVDGRVLPWGGGGGAACRSGKGGGAAFLYLTVS